MLCLYVGPKRRPCPLSARPSNVLVLASRGPTVLIQFLMLNLLHSRALPRRARLSRSSGLVLHREWERGLTYLISSGGYEA
jgi:hypothetical protein